MSDGNFNRALLPSTPYASALKAGRAQARTWAVKAFDEWLTDTLPHLTPEEHQAHVSSYQRKLSEVSQG